LFLPSSIQSSNGRENYQNLFGLLINSSPLYLLSNCACQLLDHYTLHEEPEIEVLLEKVEKVQHSFRFYDWKMNYISSAGQKLVLRNYRGKYGIKVTVDLRKPEILIMVIGIFFPLLILCCPFVTHVLPGLIVFLPMVLLFMALGGIGIALMVGFLSLGSYLFPSWKTKLFLFHRNVTFATGRIVFILVVSSLYNYMGMVYYSNSNALTLTQYGGVIEREYFLRTESLCLIDNYRENIGNTLLFFSWL
jgi:hypothetical protein